MCISRTKTCITYWEPKPWNYGIFVVMKAVQDASHNAEAGLE